MPAAIATPATKSKAVPIFEVSESSEALVANPPIIALATTCAYCGVGCGVMANLSGEGTFSVTGDEKHPANAGKLCSKGSALANTLDVDRRLREPLINGKPVSYDKALSHIAQKFTTYQQEFGADSIMLYVSGQLLTEDYYVANKFAKGFLGTNNIDSNSRLCMSSAVAGYKRAFGSDTVPCSYQDIEDSEVFVIIGSNMAWCHPILFGRLKNAKLNQSNKKVVVIDPRETDSCQIADLHLPIKGGTDTHLFNGLLRYLHEHGYGDQAYLTHCEGVDETLAAAADFTITAVAKHCDVSEADLTQFYAWFAEHKKVVSFYSMGVNQSSSGTDKVNAIINAHLYTGKMGYAGAGAFSITGQPNAMGGREVGALANLLASHFELKNASHRELVANFWDAPAVISEHDGIKSAEVADAIFAGKIKAIWIMATNPVVSLPEAGRFAKALEACDLVIVSDCSKDSDTVAYADVVLPAQGWSEKSGTVTNSERCISRQRRLLPPLNADSDVQPNAKPNAKPDIQSDTDIGAGSDILHSNHPAVKPDWWLIAGVAQRMGFTGFDYTHEQQIFAEHARLSGFANTPHKPSARDEPTSVPRSFDISHLADLTQDQYDELQPFQWGQTHYFGKAQLAQGEVYTSSGKARLIPITPQLPQSKTSAQYPLILNTGRLRDQWHTMTRTGMASQLNQHLPEPFISMHSQDAQKRRLSDGDFVQVSSPKGVALTRVKISTQQRHGDVFMPMHWNDHFASNARVGQLITGHVDPHSQQPEFKYTPVQVQKCATSNATIVFAKLLVTHQLDDAVLARLQDRLPVSSKSNDTASENSMINWGGADYWVRNRQQNSTDFLLVSLTNGEEKADSDPHANADADASSAQSQNHHTSQDWFESAYWQPSLLSWCGQQGVTSTDALQVITYEDSNGADLRLAVVHEDAQGTHLLAVLFVSSLQDKLPSNRWLDEMFAKPLTPLNRKWLLAGKPASGYVDVGRIICSCMTVGENTIIKTIKAHDCTTAAQVGKYCKAGTNCGSCISEINALIRIVNTSA